MCDNRKCKRIRTSGIKQLIFYSVIILDHIDLIHRVL